MMVAVLLSYPQIFESGLRAMQFADTGLPKKKILVECFERGWRQYLENFSGDNTTAAARYKIGPALVAQTVFMHGGECRQVAAAVSLAGPSLFCSDRQPGFDPRAVSLADEVISAAPATRVGDYEAISSMSADARLFLQVSAVVLMEQASVEPTAATYSEAERAYIHRDSHKLYSAARGEVDTFGLDARFDSAVRRVESLIAGTSAPKSQAATTVKVA